MRYFIHPKTNISRVPRDIEAVHLVRPLRAAKIAQLLKSRNIKEFSLSSSCRKRLAPKALKLVEESGARIVEEHMRGRALGIGMEKIAEAIEMHRMDKSYRDIEKKLAVPKSTAHYLIRRAARTKVRHGMHMLGLK